METIIQKIIDGFFANSKLQRTAELEMVFRVLLDPVIVIRLQAFSDAKMPALTGACKEIETTFSSTEFLNDYQNRQNVGRVLKYVMRQFGYVPIESGLGERCRIPAAMMSVFATSAVYEKGGSAKYKVDASLSKVE